MGQSAQDTISSHKAAARRVAEHLYKTRKLKLSVAESLEVIALAHGQPNWQTLHGLAKTALPAPALSTYQPVPQTAEEIATQRHQRFIERLSRFYTLGQAIYRGVEFEHPIFTRAVFNYASDAGLMPLSQSYWPWVADRIEATGYLAPWEYASNWNVQLARAAGYTWAFDAAAAPDSRWQVVEGPNTVAAPEGLVARSEHELVEQIGSALASHFDEVLWRRGAGTEWKDMWPTTRIALVRDAFPGRAITSCYPQDIPEQYFEKPAQWLRQRCADAFGKPEHEGYPHEAWNAQVQSFKTTLDYWKWAAFRMMQDGALTAEILNGLK